MATLKDVRITDPYLLAEIERARVAAGDKSSTKTAGRLILQRLAQLELGHVTGTQPVTDHDAHTVATATA